MSDTKESLRVNIRNLVNLRLEDIHEFQDDIKVLEEGEYQKFKEQVLKDGFSFSPHIWFDSNGKAWLLDGHQRKGLLKRLKEEGYGLPTTFPCTEVQVDSLEHARRLVLAGTSQYGKFQLKQVAVFIKKIGIETDDLVKRYSLPTVNLMKLTAVSSHMRQLPDGAQEKSLDFDHKCPKCGHEFDNE